MLNPIEKNIVQLGTLMFLLLFRTLCITVYYSEHTQLTHNGQLHVFFEEKN